MLLSKELSYGTDLRFKVQPECVVLSKLVPSYYDFLQYSGRTQRANVKTECRLFTIGEEGTEWKLRRNLTHVEPRPFIDGGNILKSLLDLAELRKKKQQENHSKDLPNMCTEMVWIDGFVDFKKA